MAASPARKIAYEILRRVDAGREFAVDLLHRPEVSALKDADRRLATELVMGVLRWRGELDYQIEYASGKKVKGLDPEVLTTLRLGVHQISLLERIPKAAVVNDAVELTKAARKRSAAGFVNAVLRKIEPPEYRFFERDFEHLSAENRESVRRAFPEWLLKRWRESSYAAGENGDNTALWTAFASLISPPTTLRIADQQRSLSNVQAELQTEGVVTVPCKYAAYGLAVVSGHIQTTRAYQEGHVLIQDEASQLVAELMSPEPGQWILDLCAAPGMKAGQVAQALTAGSLVACDHSAARLRTLSKLLPPWIPPDVQLSIVRLDAAQVLPFGVRFDRILLDAPCSGTGTLARNPEIKWRLHPQDIIRLAGLQANMLRNALPLLAEGGRLVYATCSLEPEENSEVVEKVLGELPGFRMLSPDELRRPFPHLVALFDPRGYFRTRPGKDSMDGFTAAVIVRQRGA